jgi:hypothetical protein
VGSCWEARRWRDAGVTRVASTNGATGDGRGLLTLVGRAGSVTAKRSTVRHGRVFKNG